MPVWIILIPAFVAQASAAALTLRLIPITRRRKALTLCAAALALLAMQSLLTAVRGWSNPARPLDAGEELTGLAASVLMVLGLLWVEPILRKLRAAAEAAQSSRAGLEARVQERTAELSRVADELRDLYDHVQCGQHSVNADNVIVRINDTELRWLGCSREEVIGRVKFVDFGVPSQRQMMLERFEELKRTGTISDFEIDLMRRDGTLLPVSINATTVRDAEGRFVMTRSTVFDLSARKEADRRLRESRDLLRAVLEGTDDGVFMKDRQGRYLVVNGVVARVAGLAAEQMIGRLDAELFDPSRAAAFVEMDRRVMSTGRTELFEENVTIDGAPRVHQTTKTAWRNPRGEVCGVVGISRDVTELKRVEQRLRQAERLAATGTMAAGIAHEVNNPVGVMLLAAQTGLTLCKKPLDAAELEGLFREIADHAARCGRIVKSLLWFARQEPTQQSPCDVNPIVARAIDLMSRFAADHGTPVESDLAAPLARVSGNAVELEHAVANLVRNAVQSGGADNRVVVRTRERGGRVAIEVQDRGLGLGAEQRARMFDPFYTTRQAEGGTGLGLSVVHGIVTAHQGRIEARGGPEGGTIFVIDLPALPEDAEEA